MREKIRKFDDIFSWLLLIVTTGLLIFSIYTVKTTPKGEGAFLFGYRPVFVLTGSMEPYMLTNGIALTKQVDSMDDIAVGDVVTFHVDSEEGRQLKITHRIVAIENGFINTKGDNNNVDDNLALTIDNIEAKVVAVFNQSAWLIEKWETTTGKIMIISFGLALIFAYIALNLIFTSRKEEKDESNKKIIDAEAVKLDNIAESTESGTPSDKEK